MKVEQLNLPTVPSSHHVVQRRTVPAHERRNIQLTFCLSINAEWAAWTPIHQGAISGKIYFLLLSIKINRSSQRKDKKKIYSLVLIRLLWKGCFLWAIVTRWQAVNVLSRFVSARRVSGAARRGHSVGWPCFIFADVVMRSNVSSVGKLVLVIGLQLFPWCRVMRGSVEAALDEGKCDA